MTTMRRLQKSQYFNECAICMGPTPATPYALTSLCMQILRKSKNIEMAYTVQQTLWNWLSCTCMSCTSAFGSQFENRCIWVKSKIENIQKIFLFSTHFRFTGLEHAIEPIFSLNACIFLDEIWKCVLYHLCSNKMSPDSEKKKFTRTPWGLAAVHK